MDAQQIADAVDRDIHLLHDDLTPKTPYAVDSENRPLQFLSYRQAAALLGPRSGPGSQLLPAPDVIIGDRVGWSEQTITAWKTGTQEGSNRPLELMCRYQVVAYLGFATPGSLKVQLPQPDAIIGDRVAAGWSEKTIDEWNAGRPGRGRWGARADNIPFELRQRNR